MTTLLYGILACFNGNLVRTVSFNVALFVLFSVVVASCSRDGQPCPSDSISESKSNGLFVHSYSSYSLSNHRVEWDIDQVWLERQCVVEGWKEVPLSGYVLRVSFLSSVDWYLDGFDKGLGIVRTRGYGRWFTRLDTNILHRFFEELPLSDTLICYLVPGIKDSIPVLDSFMLVRQESYRVDEKSSFRHN